MADNDEVPAKAENDEGNAEQDAPQTQASEGMTINAIVDAERTGAQGSAGEDAGAAVEGAQYTEETKAGVSADIAGAVRANDEPASGEQPPGEPEIAESEPVPQAEATPPALGTQGEADAVDGMPQRDEQQDAEDAATPRSDIQEESDARSAPTSEPVTASVGSVDRALARKLHVTLPKPPSIAPSFLTFRSWWVEKETKRYVEIAFDLATERFRVTLDKEVQFLNREMLFAADKETWMKILDKDTKVLECYLHEKLSGNQRNTSLALPHLQAWDLHVGARLNLFGRPTTLMNCDLTTAEWLEYHARGLKAIKMAIEVALRKYEQVPMKTSLKDSRGVNTLNREWEQGSNLPSKFTSRGAFLPATDDRGARGHPGHVLGGEDLRQLLLQVNDLSTRLAAYRPKVAGQYGELVQQFIGDLGAPSAAESQRQ